MSLYMINYEKSKPSRKQPFAISDGNNAYLLKGLPDRILTREEEDALAVEIRKSKSEDKINTLVLHSMREAFSYGIACARKLPADEVFSLCYAALRSAAPNFKPGQIRFFAYCKQYVRGEICKAFNNLPIVKGAKTQQFVPDCLLGAEVGGDRDNREETLNHIDDMLRKKVDTVEPDMEGIMSRDEWRALLPIFQERLSELERMVLELRYQSGFNFFHIGSLLKVSRQATQAAHNRAINKVRSALKGKRALFLR